MIAIKENDTVYIAYSAREMYCWGFADEKTMLMEDNLFSFVANEENGTIVAVSYFMHRADALRYNLKKSLKGELNMKSLYYDIQPEIEEIFEKKGFYANEKQKNRNKKVQVIIARDDKGYIYNIEDNNFIELEEGIIACNEDEMFSSCYDACSHITDPYEKIKTIYSLYEKCEDEVCFPVVVLDTKSKKHVIIGGKQ
ncbi:MAG: hypothetical protein IJ400_05265 [Clostridia bacterium]|nr:hypothetical protein [Clostridia bacterium]